MILRTWNLINGRQAYATSLKNKSFGNAIEFVVWSISGDYFAITGKDIVEVWSTDKADVVCTKKCEAKPTSLCWLTDSDVLVGMENGKLLFFNWENENEDATLCEIYESRVKAMKYVNGYLATASSSGELNLWKVVLDDKVEIDMICGIDVGCRLICLDILEVSKSVLEQEIKDETEEELKKTQVRQLKTKGTVTVEIDGENSDDEQLPKKRKTQDPFKTNIKTPNSNKKLKKRKSVRLSNGFVEEDA
jgi:protein MAK11